VQTHQRFSRRDIYALHDDARAPVNSGFMVTIFGGGAIASAVVGVLHTHYG
jgi:hypothetical protein